MFPERAALLGVFHGFFQRALGEPNRERADADAPAVQRAERNLQSLPFLAEAILRRHFTIVQHNLHRRRRKLPHLFFVAANTKALETRLDEKRRNSLSARLRIGLRKNKEHAGDAAVGYPSLG